MLHGHSSYLSRSSMLDGCLLRCGQLDCEALLAPVARLPTAVSIVFLRMICIGGTLGDRSKPEIGFPLRSWDGARLLVRSTMAPWVRCSTPHQIINVKRDTGNSHHKIWRGLQYWVTSSELEVPWSI